MACVTSSKFLSLSESRVLVYKMGTVPLSWAIMQPEQNDPQDMQQLAEPDQAWAPKLTPRLIPSFLQPSAPHPTSPRAVGRAGTRRKQRFPPARGAAAAAAEAPGRGRRDHAAQTPQQTSGARRLPRGPRELTGAAARFWIWLQTL